MKILVIGAGGREHALVWALKRSPSVSKIWCAPGNGGIARDAECVPANLADVAALADLAARLGADLTVVGPEQPLVLGVADEFERRGLRLLGPSQSCAQLEGSKAFAKHFLARHGIPTAPLHGVYDSAAEALEAIRTVPLPVVIKADGLCAGKGVLVTSSRDEAAEFVRRVMTNREFGDGGARLMIEGALSGPELSFIVLADGQHFVPLVPCRDHKRALDGDCGPNTGGMGVYSSDDMLSPEMRETILATIVRPTMEGLAKDGQRYRGFLYFGLMLTPQGPSVLEFNCRLGDPETQAILPRADFDLGQALSAASEGKLQTHQILWKPGAAVSVVMASGGYPGKFQTGLEITGLEAVDGLPNAAVFQAGTVAKDGKYYTCSGRVLAVSAYAENLDAARRAAYDAVAHIHFEGAHFRRDIAEAACQSAAIGIGKA